MYMNNIQTLEHPTMNGLKSLTLDDLTTDTMNASDLNADNIDGNYFSIDTIEANDIQVDAELHLTNNGFIIVGKNTPSEVIVTDDEVKHLANMRSNIQAQIDLIDNDTSGLAINVAQNTADIDANRLDISKNINYIITNTGDISNNLSSINTNTGNISSNLSLININTGDISSNLSSINTNTGNISSNLGLINTNTGNISSNNIRISSNLAAINVNAGRIFDNFADINTNANDIISTNNMLNLLEVDVGLNINSINDIESKTNQFVFHPGTYNMYSGTDVGGDRSILLHSGSNYIHLYSNNVYLGNATPNTQLHLNGEIQTKAFTNTIYNQIYNLVKLNLVSYPNWLISGLTSFTTGTTYNFTYNYEPLTDAVYAPYTVIGTGGFRVWNAGPKRLLVKYAVAFTGLSTRIVEFKTKMTQDQSLNYFTTLYSGREYTGNGTNLHDVLMYNDHMVFDMVDGDRIILTTVFNMEIASSGNFDLKCTVNMTEI